MFSSKDAFRQAMWNRSKDIARQVSINTDIAWKLIEHVKEVETKRKGVKLESVSITPSRITISLATNEREDVDAVARFIEKKTRWPISFAFTENNTSMACTASYTRRDTKEIKVRLRRGNGINEATE